MNDAWTDSSEFGATKREPNLTLNRISQVTTEKNSIEDYTFAWAARPLKMCGQTAGTHVDFSELSGAWIMGLNPFQDFSADRTGTLNPGLLGARIKRPFLESIAAEVFERGIPEFLPEPQPTSFEFESDLRRYSRLSENPGPDSRLLSESLATLISVEFLRLAHSRCVGPSLFRTRHQGLVRVRQRILHDYEENLKIHDLAKIANLSPSQFLVVFKKEWGVTPHEFLRQVRIEAAKKRLGRGEEPSTMYQAVGFSSRWGFEVAFRHFVGMSSLEYRLALRS